MHICYLCNEYPPAVHGGIGSFVQTMARALVARGQRVTVLGIYPADQAGASEDGAVQVIRLPRHKTRGLRFLAGSWRVRRCLARIHRQTPIDILEGAEEAFAIIGAFPAPKVLRMHGGYLFFAQAAQQKVSAWSLWQERRSFERADYLCGVSRYVAETTRRLLKLGDREIEVIPNPVDLTTFRPREDVPEEAGLLVFVGTITEKKGLRELVQAMPRIKERAPEARLEVYGRDTIDPATGGSYTETLQSLVRGGLAGAVRFFGSVDRKALPGILARACVCVYPSHMEAHPIAWLEGLAMGKAVVASQTGPGPEVIEDGVSGLLCDPHDPDSIARAVTAVLTDPCLRARLGKGARQRALQEYELDLLVERNLEYYRRCRRTG